jgi:hypothetical protein
MRIPRLCPTCHHPVAASAVYCPNCHQAVDPALVDELRWMYQTLADLDRRIAAGHGDQTVQALHDEIRGAYIARLTDPAVATAQSSVAPAAPAAAPFSVSVAAPPPSPEIAADVIAMPPAEPASQPFSWSAFFAERSIAIIAYTGAFLLLVATLSFEVGGWQALNATARLAIVLVVYAIFGVAGTTLFPRPRLRTVSRAYLGIFALMTPLVGLAVYQDALRGTQVSVAGAVSVTAWYTTAVYLALALRTRYQPFSYMAWIVAVLAAQTVLRWANISGDWALFTLAVSAIVLLVPHLLRLPAYLSRPAVDVSALASLILLLLVEVDAMTLVGLASADTPGTPVIAMRPFTFAAGALAVLGLGWMRTGRTVWLNIPARERAYALQWLDLAAIGLVIQAVVAIASDLGVGSDPRLGRIYMGDLLAALALGTGAVALAYLRWTPGQKLTRWGTWMMALTLPVIGWLVNASLPDPNQPLIACLSVAAIVALILASAERVEWWVVYSGLALTVVFHSAVNGALGGVPTTDQTQTSQSYLQYIVTLTSLHIALVVALWALALLLANPETTRRYSRPAYVVAGANGLYASVLLAGLPAFPHYLVYQTATLAGFTALALIASQREREPVAGGMATGIFGFLTLLPYLTAIGSYWRWFFPPLVAAAVALGVRAALGRAYAVPLYVVALLGLLIGQTRLFSDTSAKSTEALGISVAVWCTLLFGGLAILAAVLERRVWMTALPAYCALVAVVATTDQVASYVLTLVVIGTAMALRARVGRWWNLWLLGTGVLLAMAEVARFGDSDPRAFAIKLGFLAMTTLAGYASVVLTRDDPETVIAATALIFLPTLTQSITGGTPWLFTVVLATEAVLLTAVGVGMRARVQVYGGSAVVGVAAVRAAVLAYNTGVPIALVIAGIALVLLALATWLSVQSRVLAPPA